MISRLKWMVEDAIDSVLDRLSKDRRWQFIEFCMGHGLLNPCRANAYFWAEKYNDDSIFELGKCNLCANDPYCYCGKKRTEAMA